MWMACLCRQEYGMSWGSPGLCHHIKLQGTLGQCPDPAHTWPAWGMRWGVFIFCARERTVPAYEDFFLSLLAPPAFYSSCGKTVDNRVVMIHQLQRIKDFREVKILAKDKL